MSPVPADLAYFTPEEFRYPDLMRASFVRWLDRVRALAGVPMVITNDARIAGEEEPPGSAGSRSLHRKGCAVDLRTRDWTPEQKWRVAEAIFILAEEADGKVEFEPVWSPTDAHWHVGVDDRPAAAHRFVEADT